MNSATGSRWRPCLGPDRAAGRLRRDEAGSAGRTGPEHRQLAARALDRLPPPDQQTLVGTFPSPVEQATTTLVNKETAW